MSWSFSDSAEGVWQRLKQISVHADGQQGFCTGAALAVAQAANEVSTVAHEWGDQLLPQS